MNLLPSLALLTALSLPVAGQQVSLNELSAVQSDRVLQFPADGPARLGPLGPRWCDPGPAPAHFNRSGNGPFGFGYGGEGTSLQAVMPGTAMALYLRREIILTAAQAASADPLEMILNYDDGAVIFVNGIEAARRNLGADGTFVSAQQPAFNRHDATTPETISLGRIRDLLREGSNMIALQVQNNALAEGVTDIPSTAPGGGRFRCEATLKTGGAAPQTLIGPADPWLYFAGLHEPSGGLLDPADFATPLIPGPDWTQPVYAPAATWTEAPGAIGFDSGSDYYRASNVAGSQCSTNLISMLNSRLAVYLRRSFSLTPAELDGITRLNLTVDWDDGFVLFLNGYEISRSNLPGAPGTMVAWNQAATGHNASTDGGYFGNPQPGIATTLSIDKSRLRPGVNVLAAQLHNSAVSSSDLMLDVQFSASGAAPLTFAGKNTLWRYFIPAAEFATPPPATVPVVPRFYDWVELKNHTAAAVDLAGWSLSDEPDVPEKWRFPSGTVIPPDGYLVVACSGRDLKSPDRLLHTSFSLKGNGESLTLRNASGELVHAVTAVPDQDFHHTWGLDPASGQMRYLDTATPGAANTGTAAAGIAAAPAADRETGFHTTPFNVTLSCATPGAAIRYTLDGSDPTAASPVYTGTFDPVAPPVSGPGLGYLLREVWQNAPGVFTPPATIPVGTAPSFSSALTAFESPSNAGDYYSQRVRGILQVAQSGAYTFYLATDDDGELWLSQTGSPAGKQRIASVSGYALSREWSKFSSQRSVTIPLYAGQRYYIEALQSEGGGGDNLAVGWTGPGFSSITVIPGNFLSPPDGVPANFTQPAGVCLRARAFAPGLLPSEIMTRNFALNYSAGVRTSPAIFLTGAPGQTFYPPNGIFSVSGGSWPAATGDWIPSDPVSDYNFCLMRGSAFERPAVMEFVRPDNSLQFRTTLGVRFAGSPWSRPKYKLSGIAAAANWNTGWETKPQFNLFFRGDLGMARLREDGFIPGSHLNEWDTLRLRAGKNDAYNPFIIDEWMRRTFRSMGNHPAPLGFFATVFLNGQLKSYFNPTERPRDSFFQEFYDTPADWDVHYIGEWENGDATAFNQMYSYFRNTDFSTLSGYQGGAALWDPVNAADYYLLNAWAATKDWPGNNYVFARERTGGSLWRFSMWDAEGGMGMFGQANTANTFTEDLMINTPEAETFIMRLVFLRFQQSPEWKLLFADRLQKHLFNGGSLQQGSGQMRWNLLKGQVKSAIESLQGSAFYDGHWSNWSGRAPVYLTQCRNAGLWPVTQAPSFTPFGGTVSSGTKVTLAHANGSGAKLYYTTDGSDPRLPGGAVNPAALVYSSAFPVPQPVSVKARVLLGTEWSPLTEAAFAPPPPRLLISEIYYNPPGPDDLGEFVEITNTGGSPASLNGAAFTSGIRFTFGNLTLAAGQRAVVVRDAAAFAAAWPGVTPAGVFTGGLKNSGDTLTLTDITGSVLSSVTYGDASPWPAAADGDGYSLVLMRPEKAAAPASAAAWRISSAPGGSPAASDALTFPAAADPGADNDGDGFPALVEYALGTSDASAASLPLIQSALNPDGTLTVSARCQPGAEDTVLEAVTSSNLTAWSAGIPAAGSGPVLTWQCGAAGPGRTFVKIRASRIP